MRWMIVVLAGGCASTKVESAPPIVPASPPPIEVTIDLIPPREDVPVPGPVGQGELPWWHALESGLYVVDGEIVALGVGDSEDHHHTAEGFLKAKVLARLAVRRAAESIGFPGGVPEPELYDLFITRKQRFLALYRLDVPKTAELGAAPKPLPVPDMVDGAHRLGRHVFEGERHLYLECDVEGPIANPDWGRSRASAALLGETGDNA